MLTVSLVRREDNMPICVSPHGVPEHDSLNEASLVKGLRDLVGRTTQPRNEHIQTYLIPSSTT